MAPPKIKHRGPGRPPLGDAARSHVKTIKLTAAELSAQEQAVAAAGQTWTEWVRAALERALARHRRG